MSTIDPADDASAPFAPCPACGFGNGVGERACLFCGEALPFQELTRRVSRRLLDAPPEAAPPAPSRGSSPDRAAAPSSRLRRADDAAPAPPLALLCCRPLPPLPLGPVPLVTIGRGPDCHVVLPHLEVSRHHCSIKVRRQHLVLEDEGSSNGTLVNERRVATTDLRTGDVIKVGPYVLEVLDEEAAAAWELEDDQAPAVDVSHAMSGRIDAVPLAEVLQQLEFNARTGTLQVASGRRRGQLVVEGGRPLSAAFQGLRDDAAVLAMLALEEGRFSFARTSELGPRRMDGATLTALLLESSRRADEGRPAVSGADWDLQAEGAALAPTIGAVGPTPRAPRLSPAATPPPFSAVETAVPDAATPPAPYTARDLAPAPAPDTVVLPPGSLDDDVDDVQTVIDADALLRRDDVRPDVRTDVRDDARRARSDRLPLLSPSTAPAARPAPAAASRLPWAVAGALALACAAALARAPRAAGPDAADLAERAAALAQEVDQQLASPRALLADGPAIGSLRGRLTALRTLGAPAADLARAEAGVGALEGLAAAARGDAAALRSALGRVEGAPARAASALLGAAAALGVTGDADVAVEHLSLAIEGGVLRPELRAWRARARGRQALDDVGRAAAVLDDLRVFAAGGGLGPDDDLLRARALLVLGRDHEAAPVLERLRAHHDGAARDVALARVEQALGRGDVALAARLAAAAPVGDEPPPHARAMAARVRRLAEPLLDDLRQGRLLSAPGQGRLVDLLRLARLLGGAPLDDGAAAALLDALERPGQPLPQELCLGAAELLGRDDPAARRRVLRRLYRAMEEDGGRGEANLTLLICFVVGAEPRGLARPTELLEAVRAPHVRVELFHARALAREELGRLRDAELDARRALLLAPDRADLQALRARLAAAAREAATRPAPPPPAPRPRRRVG